MPRSKHRRKPGVGKSIKHPGRGKAPRWTTGPNLEAYHRMRAAVVEPFYREHGESDAAAELLRDVISELWHAPITSRADATARILEPFEEMDGTDPTFTPEQVEAGWVVLVEREIVAIDGDTVTVHPRIAQHFAAAPAMRAQSPDQFPSEASA
jgi:hypothetical protein